MRRMNLCVCVCVRQPGSLPRNPQSEEINHPRSLARSGIGNDSRASENRHGETWSYPETRKFPKKHEQRVRARRLRDGRPMRSQADTGAGGSSLKFNLAWGNCWTREFPAEYTTLRSLCREPDTLTATCWRAHTRYVTCDVVLIMCARSGAERNYRCRYNRE